MVRPELNAQFAAQHDSIVWQCFATLLGLPEGQPAVAVSMPLNKGGWDWGAQSDHGVQRTGQAGLIMVNKRDPAMAR